MSEVSRCMLCHDPVCTKACPQKAPVREILRSMYFENYLGASKKIGKTDCTYCNAPCEKACILSKDSVPVKIRQSIMDMTIGKKHLPEELIERFTRAAKKGTSLPVLVKLTPNITDMVPMALAAKRGGADGISAINTINSITGVDIDTLVAQPADIRL